MNELEKSREFESVLMKIIDILLKLAGKTYSKIQLGLGYTNYGFPFCFIATEFTEREHHQKRISPVIRRTKIQPRLDRLWRQNDERMTGEGVAAFIPIECR